MRKTFLLAMILLVSAAWAVAQQDPNEPTPQSPSTQHPNAQPPDTTAPPPAADDAIEGCLGGGAGNFTLTDKTGTTYQLQLPQGTDTDNLNKHVGEKVRVTGSMANAAGGNQASIQVARMNKIADSCGIGSTATPSK